MFVQCPSCKTRKEIDKAGKDTSVCNSCGTPFEADNSRLTNDIFRVWRVRGERDLPVSWRVLKYRAKTGKLSEEHEISDDGDNWVKAGDYPELLRLFHRDGDDNSLAIPKESLAKKHKSSSNSFSPHNHSPNIEPKTLPHQKRKGWKAAVALAIFAIISAGMFFFPLSKRVQSLDVESQDLRLYNLRLKGELSVAKTKIDELGENLASMYVEFEKVTRSNEEFEMAKSMLEDIKRSIDSNKIYLSVSLAENRLYVKTGAKTLKSYVVSTGKGETVLKTTGETYNFLTPRGKRLVLSRQKNPVWVKPDWAWLENGDSIPDNISIQERTVEGELGKFRLNLGAGYAIHGTRKGKVDGKKETHGCIRMGRNDLQELYAMAKRGTEVYIY